MSTKRPRIALDLVDVVEDSWPRKRAWVLQRFGSDVGTTPRSRTTLEGILSRRHRVVGHSAYETMSAEIATPRGILARPPIADVVSSLHLLRPFAHLVLLSGRREEKRKTTETWLERNGLDWLAGERLRLFGYRTTCAHDRNVVSPKLRWCLEEGVDAYVDNQARQLAMVSSVSDTRITRVLFSADPAEARRIYGPVRVAKNWKACVLVLADALSLPADAMQRRGNLPHRRGASPRLAR